MSPTDPHTWVAPNWHSDWEKADSEFEALKQFSIELLHCSDDFSVELDEIEEGYQKVDLFNRHNKLAELYPNTTTDGFQYILYIPFEKTNERECHFHEISEGIELIRRYV